MSGKCSPGSKRFKFLLAALLLCGLGFAPSVQQPSGCQSGDFMPTRLASGITARVTESGGGRGVYADYRFDSEILATLQAAAVMPLANAVPACSSGVVWWQVQFQDIGKPETDPIDFGWVPEGVEGNYWLEPILPVWNIPTQRLSLTPENFAQMQPLAKGNYGVVTSMAWSPDSAKLALSAGVVWLHDLTAANNTPVMLFPYDIAQPRITHDLKFAPEGSRLITLDDSLHFWSLTPLSEASRYAPSGIPPNPRFYINSTGRLLAAPLTDQSIALIDTEQKITLHTFMGQLYVGEMAFSPDSRLLAVGGGINMGGVEEDTTLRLWEVPSHSLLSVIEIGAPASTIGFSSDGRSLAVGFIPLEGSPSLMVIDAANQTTRYTLTDPQYALGPSFAFSPDSRILAVEMGIETPSEIGGKVLFYDALSGDLLADFSVDGNIIGLSFSPDGTLLAAAHSAPYALGPYEVEIFGISQ